MRTEIELRNDFSKQKISIFHLNIVFCKVGDLGDLSFGFINEKIWKALLKKMWELSH